jgi:hypothetical protein
MSEVYTNQHSTMMSRQLSNTVANRYISIGGDSGIEPSIKFTLCVRRTQEGKTFTTINKISTEIERDDDEGRSIHFVFTMNTLLNNRQFAKRLTVIEETYGKGSIAVFASKYEGKYTHVKNLNELKGICFDEDTCPRVIAMCSNSVRYEDAVEFIKCLDKNRSCISRVFCYYDELHKYINDTLRREIEEIDTYEIVKGIIGLSASPDPIFQKSGYWARIRLIQLDHFDDKNYIGYKDIRFNIIDDIIPTPYVRPSKKNDCEAYDFQTLDFVEQCLDRNPSILANTSRVFIPAHIRRQGHFQMRNLIFRKNPEAVVVVLNGIEKALNYKINDSMKTVPIASNDDEACDIIAEIIQTHQLENRPLVITGFLCIGMGQTLVNEYLGSFTHSIISHVDLSNDEIYQLFGRLTGRMKAWAKYRQTELYCPTVIMNRCMIMEECARRMAIDFNGDVVSEEDYIAPMHEFGEIGLDVFANRRNKKSESKKAMNRGESVDKEHRVFDLQEEAIEFSQRELGHRLNKRKTDIALKEFLDENGNNPTVENLLKRMWGVNEKSPVRMIPTDQKKWCVYWRPSLITK